MDCVTVGKIQPREIAINIPHIREVLSFIPGWPF